MKPKILQMLSYRLCLFICYQQCNCHDQPMILGEQTAVWHTRPLSDHYTNYLLSYRRIYYSYLTWTLKLTTFMHVATFYFWHLQRERFSAVNYRCQNANKRVQRAWSGQRCAECDNAHIYVHNSGRGRGEGRSSGASAAPFELHVEYRSRPARLARRCALSRKYRISPVARTCIKFRKWVMFLGLRPSCQLSCEQCCQSWILAESRPPRKD